MAIVTVREGGTRTPLCTSGCDSRQKVTLELGDTRTIPRAMPSPSRSTDHWSSAGQWSPTPRSSTGCERSATALHADAICASRSSPAPDEQSNSVTLRSADTHSDGTGSHHTRRPPFDDAGGDVGVGGGSRCASHSSASGGSRDLSTSRARGDS
eukprot:529018-Prymnesium_polylepis.2